MAAPQVPDLTLPVSPFEADAISPAMPDTAVIITPDSIATLASEEFKQWRLRKFDGEDGATLYPAAHDLYVNTVSALERQPEGSRGQMQCVDILKQINPDLMKAAFFFSSAGNQPELNRFARAYLDTQIHPRLKDVRWERDNSVFPSICYIAASSAYNSKEWDRAIDYFKLYLGSGATERREQVYQFMSHAALDAGNYPVAIATTQEAMRQYPNNELLPMIGIQACIDGGHGQFLQDFLTHALTLKPSDTRLLTLQGELYEDNHDYRSAIDLFNTLDQINPNMLSVTRHLGMNYYNMAVTAFNRAINEENEKENKRLRRQARNYFDAAALKFRAVLETDPTLVKYLRALGVCYLCLEDKSSFAEINGRLSAMGEDPLENVFMPPMMSYSDSGSKNFATSNLAEGGVSIDAPSYTDFATNFITEQLGKWSERGEFEPLDRYSERVNEQSIRAEAKRLGHKAAEDYLRQYGGNLRLNGLKLLPYDVTNEVFKIESNFGPIIVHVPLKNNEAETFKSTFAGIDISAPRYFIDEDGVKIASVTLITPGGKSYKYDNAKALAYNDVPDIDIDFNSILRPSAPDHSAARQQSRETYAVRRKSDVDEKIPVNSKKLDNRVALIIANEVYAQTADVASATNDGLTMAEYCKKVMGMPDNNVILLNNATFAQTIGGVTNLRNRVEALGGDAEVVVYYAGHGFPDERTKDAYLLPVDGIPTAPRTCYALSDLYNELGNMSARSVMVFLDACFSGAQRTAGGEMISDARSVVIKPKETAPKGNMLVLSATSGNETALPYTDKNHGLFTYYLLKKLQDTKGNTTLKELSDYVIENVKRQSNFINSKPQTPTVSLSGNMGQLWQNIRLRP